MTKYQSIEVYQDGRLVGKGGGTWLDIAKSSDLIYLSFSEGRVYFGYQHPSNTIVNFAHNDEKHTVSFRYIGFWEDEYHPRGGEDVNLLFEIVFKDAKEYEEVREIWNIGEKTHVNEDLIEGVRLNDFLTIKQVNNGTYINIDENRFLQCIQLRLNIPKNEIPKFDKIDSIDDSERFSEITR